MRTLAVLFALLLAGQAFAATPQDRYAEAAKVLLNGCNGTGCDFGVDTKEEVAALDAIWAATQDWTVAFLNDHPALKGEALRTELLNRQSGPFPTQIVPVAPGLYAAFAQYNEMGNVFLLREAAGRVSVVWDIRQAEASRFPILTAWRNDAANGMCRSNSNHEEWGRCGPLFPFEIKTLPPDSQGRPRFYLNATYAQAAETTVGAQLSIWALENDSPKIVWAKRYAYNFEDESWKLDGQILKIRATDWWHTLYACGTCVGRQMDWTVRIRPDGVDDLGMRPVVPELDAFDELAWRVFKKQDARDLATPEVLARLAQSITQEKAAIDDLDKDHSLGSDYFSFSMLGGFEVRKVGSDRELCVLTDEVGFRVRFARRAGRLFAVDLEQLPEADGKFCRKRAG